MGDGPLVKQYVGVFLRWRPLAATAALHLFLEHAFQARKHSSKRSTGYVLGKLSRSVTDLHWSDSHHRDVDSDGTRI
jgi:hypothetical protein